ncbi:MAG TPA: preprotein translocase subunit YajC [Polyangia bacterium]|jgi:preprotein translocase subunit YajC|nr:preprotein translocase subunit YajC [Polyangia bacterium]
MIQSLLWQAPSAAPSGNAAPPAAGPPSAAPTSSTTSAPPAGPAGFLSGAGLGNPIVLFPLLLVMMYFIMIRPEQKRRKETEGWLKSLKKGDEVATTGGLIGRISGLDENVVTLEVQEKVRVKVLRSSVTGKAPGAAKTAAASETEKK